MNIAIRAYVKRIIMKDLKKMFIQKKTYHMPFPAMISLLVYQFSRDEVF